jgi:hypothetical protein
MFRLSAAETGDSLFLCKNHGILEKPEAETMHERT